MSRTDNRARGGHRKPDFEQAVTARLTRLFGPAAAEPETMHLQDRSRGRWTAPATVQHLTDHSLFGHPLYRRPATEGRLHWASTETATQYAGHIEGTPAAAERAVTATLTTKEANPCSGQTRCCASTTVPVPTPTTCGRTSQRTR
ncbi:hypothetical protein ACFV29_22200 [Streptomyces sp. NPDC059690]|uniref:hypothetical protein n=1 Tax=Streptomyces sp. NPDC059690 TaxID=3346907 RepID=UPI0036BF6A20